MKKSMKKSVKKSVKKFLNDLKPNKNPHPPPNLPGHSEPALPTATSTPAVAGVPWTPTAQPLSVAEALKIFVDGCTEALEIAKEPAGIVPMVGPALKACAAAIALARKVISNWTEMEQILKRIEKIQPVMQALVNRLSSCDCRFEDQEKHLYSSILTSIETLKEEGDKICTMQSRGHLINIARGTTNAARLLSAYKNIEQAIGDLRLALQLAIERDTSTIRKNQALQSLPVASAAAHTSGLHQSNVTRRECTEGTRTQVLEDIRSWLRSDDAAPVFWLTGAAGMGKTTIAMTICGEIQNHFNSPVDSPVIAGFDRCPLVSFFASRQLDSGEARHFLPSICRRLADHSSSYGQKLAGALERDSTLATATFDNQFNNMLVKPWEDSISERTVDIPNVVILVDALDENKCGFYFLERLLGAVNNGKLGGLCFLVTSRTEQRIAQLCSSFKSDAVCRLQDLPLENVGQDILRYLQQELSGLQEDTLQLIAEKSSGLFIYATTVVKVSKGSRGSTVKEQERIVGKLLSAKSNNNLDSLYLQIVEDTLQHDDKDTHDNRLRILRVILCAVQTLPVDVIAQLTDTDEEDVSFVVHQLHAVMYVAYDGRIQTYHASFADFVLRNDCSIDAIHAILVQRCYTMMKKQLHFNICGLESSFVMDKDVPDLQNRVDTKIHLTLRYVVVYWTTHLERSTPSHTVCRIPELFVDEILLYWMEVVNLLNIRIDAMHALYSAKKWISEHVFSAIDIWDQAINFCRSFTSGGACESTPHIYMSTLSTWDPQSYVSKCWQPRLPHIPKVSAEHSSGIILHISAQQLNSVAISPDGKQIVSGGHQSLCLWDAASGEQRKGLTGYSGTIYSVAFSPKGDQIVSGGDDGVYIWNATSGEQQKKLTGHSGVIKSVTFSPTGYQIVSGGKNGSVYIWDVASGKQENELTGHSGMVHSVAFSPNGNQIVSGGEDGSVCVWDATSGKKLKEITGHSNSVQCVAFSPKGDQIVSGGEDDIYVWNVTSGEKLNMLTGHLHDVLCVAFSPNGDQIVSGGTDKSLRIWDAATGKLQKELTGHLSPVWSVAFLPKGNQILSGSDDGSVCIWDAASGEHQRELKGHAETVQSVAFSPKGNKIVSGGDDGTVCVWDAATGQQQIKLTGHESSPQWVAFSPKGDQIVSWGENGSVQFWDAASGEMKKLIRCSEATLCAAFSPKWDQFVSVQDDGSMDVWNVASGEHQRKLKGHQQKVYTVAFSPEGDQIVSGGHDGSVCLWDVASGEQQLKLMGQSGSGVTSVAFSPIGDIVSGGKSGESDAPVCFWDAENEEWNKQEFLGHSGDVCSVAFSPDSNLIVSGGMDGSVIVWDTYNAELAKQLTGHSNGVFCVQFSPKGDQIVSGGGDGSVRIWDIAELTGHQHPEPLWDFDCSSGWIMQSSPYHHLIWLPSHLRNALYTPQTQLIMSRHHPTVVSFQWQYLGKGWTLIHQDNCETHSS